MLFDCKYNKLSNIIILVRIDSIRDECCCLVVHWHFCTSQHNHAQPTLQKSQRKAIENKTCEDQEGGGLEGYGP